MGYLDKYLRNNPAQIVNCDDLYNLWLLVDHPTGIIQITVNDSDGKVSLLVLKAIPDPEDWQYGGDSGTQYLFKFHSPSDRGTAKNYLDSLGYTTETRDFRR